MLNQIDLNEKGPVLKAMDQDIATNLIEHLPYPYLLVDYTGELIDYNIEATMLVADLSWVSPMLANINRQDNYDRRIFIDGQNWVCHVTLHGQAYLLVLEPEAMDTPDDPQGFARSLIQAEEVMQSGVITHVHDSLQCYFLPALIRLQALEERLKRQEDKKLSKLCTDAKQLLNTGIRHSRVLMKSVVPSALLDFGLVQAIEDLIKRFNTSTNGEIILEAEAIDLTSYKAMEMSVYKICREALYQLLGQSLLHFKLEIRQTSDALSILFVTTRPTQIDFRELDLTMLQGRIHAQNGNFQLQSEPNRHLQLTIILPLEG